MFCGAAEVNEKPRGLSSDTHKRTEIECRCSERLVVEFGCKNSQAHNKVHNKNDQVAISCLWVNSYSSLYAQLSKVQDTGSRQLMHGLIGREGCPRLPKIL